MASMATVATIATLAGTAVTAAGTIAAGKAQENAMRYEAQQLDMQAQEERAASQRDMLEHRREKKLALSRLQNLAAASGFSATDKTALDLTGDIAQYGTYKEQMALYGGASRSAGYRAQAEGRRMTGRAARVGSYFDAGGTILGGISTMADRYAPKKPTGPTYNYYYGGS